LLDYGVPTPQVFAGLDGRDHVALDFAHGWFGLWVGVLKGRGKWFYLNLMSPLLVVGVVGNRLCFFPLNTHILAYADWAVSERVGPTTI
jgi:hypothetical protein